MKTGSTVLMPNAVEFPSSSSSKGAFSEAEDAAGGGLSSCAKRGCRSSFELLMIRSDSLSLSSYSS